uniref:Uncharacterized protein n=1 Tax=Arundo donax TaxID=35708 RepID=A0A0A9B1W4_ARUDO
MPLRPAAPAATRRK